MRILVSVLASAVLAVGCSAGAGPEPTPAASPTGQPTAAPTAPVTTTPAATPAASPTQETPELPDLVGEVPEDVLLEIMQSTADATGANLAELTIERAEAVTWSDGSLGCPEPGQSYVQVLLEGYWVVIEAGGETYDFRVNQAGEWKLCPAGRGRPPIDEQY